MHTRSHTRTHMHKHRQMLGGRALQGWIATQRSSLGRAREGDCTRMTRGKGGKRDGSGEKEE